jgi:hypothetical protein
MQNLRNFACVVAALGAVALVGCSSSSGPDATLRVRNNSDFAITEIHVTSVGSSSWGPNLISGDVLLPDEALTVDVTCDTYDALLVDEDGVDCQLHNVDLCFSDAVWVINNQTCSVFGAARAAREAAAKAAGSAAPASGSAAQ